MTRPTRRRLPARIGRAAATTLATALTAAALALGPAAAQQSDPAKDSMEKEFQRIAEERAARVRDLLTIVAIAAREDMAISFGRVEASADGETIRIHNVVLVDREQPAVQVMRLVELKDFDRRHTLPRRLRLRGDSDVLLATMPPQIKAIFQQLNLPHVRSFSTVEYVYDEEKGVLNLKSFDVEWMGQFKLAITATVENFPKLNEILEASRKGNRVARRLEQAKFSALTIEIRSRTLHEFAYSAMAMFGSMTKAQARQQALAMLQQRAQSSSTDLERQLAAGLRVLASGPGVLTATFRPSPALAFAELQNQPPNVLMQRLNAKVTARNAPAAEALPGKLPEAWTNLPVSDVTDPGVHECDRYAASPADSAKKIDGVPDRAIDKPMALAACRRATLEFPKAARFQFQYGRALWLSNLPAAAQVWLKLAAAGGYEAAKGLLAKRTK